MEKFASISWKEPDNHGTYPGRYGVHQHLPYLTFPTLPYFTLIGFEKQKQLPTKSASTLIQQQDGTELCVCGHVIAYALPSLPYHIILLKQKQQVRASAFLNRSSRPRSSSAWGHITNSNERPPRQLTPEGQRSDLATKIYRLHNVGLWCPYKPCNSINMTLESLRSAPATMEGNEGACRTRAPARTFTDNSQDSL